MRKAGQKVLQWVVLTVVGWAVWRAVLMVAQKVGSMVAPMARKLVVLWG